MVEQQRQQEQLQAKAELDLIVDTLQRESVEETRLAARLWQLGKEKDVVTENRLLREKQYKERRDADWRAHLLREAEMHKSLKEQFSAEAAAELEIWRTAEANKVRATTPGQKTRRTLEGTCRDWVGSASSGDPPPGLFGPQASHPPAALPPADPLPAAGAAADPALDSVGNKGDPDTGAVCRQQRSGKSTRTCAATSPGPWRPSPSALPTTGRRRLQRSLAKSTGSGSPCLLRVGSLPPLPSLAPILSRPRCDPMP